MEAITYSDFKKRIKFYLNRITDDFEPLTITRKHRPSVVIISEKAYNNLLENQFILSNPANVAWLEESRKQLEASRTAKKQH
ncbi:hypothetical protein FC99_GL002179 [Levilactobacillus koreensis JCM 16448]|uniref:Antitoxin n=1 Tax=Levilactobacillus koreensis TaxID=637971 RepID=A0AAC8UW93_9LACO|nr:type II toxin-antitoxin system Phd/YefM family antitoxin [Levilactobacillus koreensis]AKP64837.1 hypothetical protein ABN16_07395 [Levilactobacillus koreensis]KRK85905.1 hypothetical protein FC99_GL002179 [Levilactobacillus koreensis JCM 16448]